MDGVAALRVVLTGDAALTALYPAAQIVAGVLPLGAPINSIAIESISKVDRNIPSPGAYRHVTERVRVTVHGAEYPKVKAGLRAVRAAAADQINPAVDGISRVTIHTDGAGPDGMTEDSSIHFGSQDFRVTYSEER